MAKRLSVALVLLLLSLTTAASSTEAQQSQSPAPQPTVPPPQSQQQQQPPPQPAQQPATPATGTTSLGEDLISIDRIRKELERQPKFTYTMPNPNLPVYRLRVEGYRFQLPTWQQNFAVPHSSVPLPIGGSDYYEMQRLNTPPQAWGSAPFTNRDVLGMLVSQATSSLAVALIKKGIEAHQNGEPARARAEVQQELADVAAHNARVAAGQPGDGATTSDATKASAEEKKKQDEKKKQEEEKKKKKKDGGQ